MLRRCYVVAKLSRALDESEVAVSIDFAPTTAYRLNDEGHTSTVIADGRNEDARAAPVSSAARRRSDPAGA
jgi:hypothetical protein